MNNLKLDKEWIDNCGCHPIVEANAETGMVEIYGELYSGCTKEYFKPFLDWLKVFLDTSQKKLTINFKMTYFNTPGSKYLLSILKLVETYKKREVSVNWYYLENEKDMKEESEDLFKDLVLKVNVIPVTDF